MGIRSNFSKGKRRILLKLFRLLTIQCKQMFIKRFTLSTQKKFVPFYGNSYKNSLCWQQQPGILQEVKLTFQSCVDL